ncbi:hypothetical protein BgiMline_036566 [Biomphalaria glabrata]|nr:hypothetical protein BgiMline_015051 [Biomphalaria glabrata]
MSSHDSVGNGDVHNYNSSLNNKCFRADHDEHFKPINGYKNSNIAEFCERYELFKFIDAVSPLTVKITVQHTSVKRKEKNHSYNYSTVIGDREASGFILDIKNVNDKTVKIATAMHVVFNEDEARGTSCYMYYDGEDSKTVNLIGTLEKVDADINKDWCVFTCRIDAQEFENVIQHLTKYKTELSKKICKRNAILREKDKKVLLLSHPHGCYKYVSMGDLVMEKDSNYSYKTPTCAGSSGGYLVIVGFSKSSMFVHSGCDINEEKKIGYSSGEITLHSHSKQ